MSGHYAGDREFRSSDGSGATLEMLAPSRPDSSFTLSVDSWDGPEQGLRVDAETARALVAWLQERLP